MALIKIDNLQTAGYDLFNDSENYLNELSDRELDIINGGMVTPTMTVGPISSVLIPVIITMM